MAQIYGELIRAQLQAAAGDLSNPANGLIYLHATEGVKWYNSSLAVWKTTVDLNSTQILAAKTLDATCSINLSALPIVSLAKGGLGADASAWSGFVRISAGTASAAALTSSDLPLVPASKGGTGVANNDAATLTRSGNHDLTLTTIGSTSVTLPTTGTLATLAGSESLSSKTLVEPIIDNFLTFNEEASGPAVVSGGKVAVYAKEDGKIYKKDDTQTETEIGGSGTGTGRNYLQDWFDGSKPIGTVLTGFTATGNRSFSGGANLQWGASSTSNMTIGTETVNPLRQTSCIKIDSLNTTSGAFVETPVFALDNADLGKPISIEFDIGDIAASTSYDIVVMQYAPNGVYEATISVAGNASTGSPASAQLPTGTTKFRGFFIPAGDASHYYSLRFRKLAAVDDDFLIDSLFVGPQSLAQGAVVTAWTEEAITWNQDPGLSTTSAYIAPKIKWRRVGSSMEGLYDFRNGGSAASNSVQVSFRLPQNLTIDLTKYTALPGSTAIAGFAKKGSIAADQLNIYPGGAGTPSKSVYIYVSNTIIGANDVHSGWFSVPISEWSSGTTTLADRAVEEYVSFDGSIARGPAGSLVPNVAFGTSTTAFNIDFQQSLNATDSVVLEFSRAGLGWQNAADIYAWSSGNNGSGSNFYGMRVYKLNATQYTVEFGNQGIRVAISNQNAGATSWADERIQGTRWRLRKVSSGAAVGFPVSARNIVGDTSGTAVPSGYVGEKLISTVNSSVSGGTANNTYYDVSGLSLTLTPGVWRLESSTFIQISATSINTNASYIYGAALRDSSNTVVDLYQTGGPSISSNQITPQFLTTKNSVIVTVTNNTTYKVSIRFFYGGGAADVGTKQIDARGDLQSSNITATRIA